MIIKVNVDVDSLGVVAKNGEVLLTITSYNTREGKIRGFVKASAPELQANGTSNLDWLKNKTGKTQIGDCVMKADGTVKEVLAGCSAIFQGKYDSQVKAASQEA